MSGLISIGITGMAAAQYGLLTTEHNISNATTAGYTRQRTIQATNIPLATGSGFVGQGSHVSTIERLYSQHLTNQSNRAQTAVSELETYYAEIKQIDNMLADANSGISPALQDFFRGVQQVAANPSQLPGRQSLISSAEAMVARFQGMEGRLAQIGDGINQQITATVTTINSYAQQLSQINEQIIVAQGASNQPPNDLLDRRDLLVTELNKLVQVSVTTNTDGSYNVFFGSGQQLVVGVQYSTLTASAASSDDTRIVIGLKTAGATQELPEALVTGGALGGLLRFRSEALDSAMNELGRSAASLALTFNAQHSLGQDLLGQVAGDAGFVGDFFTFSQPRITENAYNDGTSTISASFLPPSHNGTNFYTDLTGHDYQISFVADDQFTITDMSSNTVVASGSALPAGASVSFDGVSVNIGTGGIAGDSFLLQPTREVARNVAVDLRISSDPRLIAAAAPVRTGSATTNTGTAEITPGSVATGYTLANLPLNLRYDSTLNALVDVAGIRPNIPYSSGATITVDGISFAISGRPGNNDTFSIAANSSGTADSRNGLALGLLQSQQTMSGGTATYQSAYAELVSENGNRTRATQVVAESQRALLKQSQSAREALSGVNLDEEAANLIRFQQAYQASAKMIDIGSKLFDVLLSIRS